MADVPLSALNPRQRKLVENARAAVDSGNCDYALEACQQILQVLPGCVEVRRVHRAAQLQRFQNRSRLLARTLGGLSSTPFIFSSASRDPLKALASAERILAMDPTSAAALKMLAEAAAGLELPGTVAFAREAVRELAPDDTENLFALGKAFIALGQPAQALQAADELLRLRPNDAAAQDLLREAAIAQAAPGAGAAPAAPRGGAREAESPEPDPTLETRAQLAALLQRVAEDPDRLSLYREIVGCFRRLGLLNEAMAWARKARERPGGVNDLALERQEGELGAELLASQVRIAESALIASPGDPEVQARVAAAKRELASFRLYEAKRYAELHPHDLPARLGLGQACLEHGQADAAIAHFQQAVQDPGSQVAARIGLGRAQRARGQPEAALAQFILAKAGLGPMDDVKKQVVYQLAECYEQLGRNAEAIAEYKDIYAADIEYRDVAAKINAFFR